MNTKRNPKKKYLAWLLPGAAVLLAAALVLLPPDDKQPSPEPETRETMPLTHTQEPVELGDGLRIERMDRYAGVYMEDGSGDIVQDVMMLQVRNTSEQDLQLARIKVHYGDFTAEFEVTNLPAGAQAVLLERSRRSVVSEPWLSAEAQNVVFFPEAMDLMPDRLELGGTAGVVEVTNISGEALTEPVYIYYKNTAGELFYGGITYRVALEQGLAAGETIRIPAGHYDSESSTFVMAECAG